MNYAIKVCRTLKKPFKWVLKRLEEALTRTPGLEGGFRKIRMAIMGRGKGERATMTNLLVSRDKTVAGLCFIYGVSERVCVSNGEMRQSKEANGL